MIQGELRAPVPPSSIPFPTRRCVPSAECQDFQVGRQATKPWNRGLSTGSRIQVPFPAVSRNKLRCDPLLCPDRASRRPLRLPRVARNWNFESSSLLRGVCKLSVPGGDQSQALRKASDSDGPRGGWCSRPQRPDALDVFANASNRTRHVETVPVVVPISWSGADAKDKSPATIFGHRQSTEGR